MQQECPELLKTRASIPAVNLDLSLLFIPGRPVCLVAQAEHVCISTGYAVCFNHISRRYMLLDCCLLLGWKEAYGVVHTGKCYFADMLHLILCLTLLIFFLPVCCRSSSPRCSRVGRFHQSKRLRHSQLVSTASLPHTSTSIFLWVGLRHTTTDCPYC